MLCMPLSECVSLCLSSRGCATTAVTVRVFCCKVNGALPAHLALSRSTAGAAVSDKRVSAAAAADQASLPGLGIQGSEHILAQIGIYMRTHACGSALLTHTQYSLTCIYTQHATSAQKSVLMNT